VTSIAIRRVDTGDTRSFSIHLIAEREHVNLHGIEARYDELERKMLDEFFDEIHRSGEVDYLHWNMRDSNFGFAALEHRYRVLGGSDITRIDGNHRHDLSLMLKEIYGSKYIAHPRLKMLAVRNDISLLRFLSGAEEPEAFKRKDYVALHQSTLRKVAVLESIAERAHRGTLRTDSSWWILHGGTIRAVWSLVVANQTILFFLAVIGVALAVVALWPRPVTVP